jgi:hypothetical protein
MPPPSNIDPRFEEILGKESLTLGELQAASFSGIPDYYRPIVWKLLLGYLPLQKSLRNEHIERTRIQYAEFTRETAARPTSQRASRAGDNDSESEDEAASINEATRGVEIMLSDESLRSEIAKDIERTNPELNWFNKPEHTEAMARILYVYARLNSGVRYVQGMNEILSPLWYVFATDRSSPHASASEIDEDPEAESKIAAKNLANAEAETFFCFMALMSEIRELFISAHDNGELGVRGVLMRYSRLLTRREPRLAEHFSRISLPPEFYCFRWITTMLTREFPFPEVIMLWDTLLADPHRFAFLLHMCVGMVRAQKDALLRGDFNVCVKLLQNYPGNDFLQLLGVAMQLRAEDNADVAAHGGPQAGDAGPWRDREGGGTMHSGGQGMPSGAPQTPTPLKSSAATSSEWGAGFSGFLKRTGQFVQSMRDAR